MAHVTAFVVQQAFRGRNDDGTLATATDKSAGNNVNFTQAAGKAFRLRFVIEETAGGAANNYSYLLQYNRNAAGWITLAMTGAVRSAASAFVANGTATAQRISTGAFVAGEFDSSSDTSNISLSLQKTEMEYCLILDSSLVNNNDSIQFRVTNAGTPIDGYTNTPTVTASVISSIVLTGSNSLQANTSTTGSVTQQSSVSGNNSLQSNTSTQGAVTQRHTLSGNNSVQANTTTAGAVTFNVNLTGSNSTQANTVNAGAVAQKHNLAGSSSTQVNSVTAGAVAQTHKLAASNSAQANTTTAGAVSSSGTLTASNSLQANTTSSGAVGQTHKLTASNSVQANTTTSGAMIGDGALIGSNSTQPNTTTAAKVTQKHILTGSNSKQVNVVTGGEVDQAARVSMKKLRHIYNIAQLHGLDPNNPVSVSPQGREAGDTRQTISGDGKTLSAVESQQLSAMSGNAEDWIDALAAIYGITERVEITQSGRTAGFVSQTFTKNGDQMVVSRNA